MKKVLLIVAAVIVVLAGIGSCSASKNGGSTQTGETTQTSEDATKSETAQTVENSQANETTETETSQKASEFKQVGYFKEDKPAGGANRSFTIYTTSTDENEMIEYARKMMNSTGSFTYVHFYNNLDATPDITLYAAEYAYNPEQGKENRIFVYQKSPNGNEFAWNGAMSENRQL